MTARDVHSDDMFDDPVVDAFARDVREAAASTPAPVPGSELASIFRDGLPPVPEPNRVPAAKRVRRRRGALRGAVAGLVAGLGVGGLGVAGALPDPVQRQVVRAAKVIGVELPAPDDGVDVETEVPDDEPVTPATTVVDDEVRPPAGTPAVTAPGQVDEDDDAPGRGRGRGRGGEQRDDRAGDAGIETTTTSPARSGPPTTSTSLEDGEDGDSDHGRDDEVDDDSGDLDELEGDQLDDDSHDRNRGPGGDSDDSGDDSDGDDSAEEDLD